MHPKIGTFTSDWILNSPNQTVADISFETDIQNQMFDMPENSGSAVFSRYILPMGLALSNAKSFYTQLIPGRKVASTPVILDFNENTLFIQNLRTGSNSLREEISNENINYGYGLDHVRFQSKFVLHNNFHLDDQVDLYTLSLPFSVLAQMLGNSIADSLLDKLELNSPPIGRVVKSVPKASQALYDAFDTDMQYTGQLLKIFLQTKALEFISTYAANFLAPTHKKNNSSRNIAYDIHHEITHCGADLPTLDLICKKYNKPARVLNEIFTEKYGLSIVKFIIKVRLEQAHEIVKNTDLPLKVIADRVGYSHVNNFTNAFSKHFGYPPGQLRKII